MSKLLNGDNKIVLLINRWTAVNIYMWVCLALKTNKDTRIRIECRMDLKSKVQTFKAFINLISTKEKVMATM